jgi:hypothetical protein
MITLEDNHLVFRFPEIEENASFSIDFQRTLRIPDTEKTYPLPPGLGNFPLRHTEDFEATLPKNITEKGGIILPMWQAEAMWLNFSSNASGLPDFPVAIKVASGKINAVTGDPWQSVLQREPQDYMVSPNQPWLDGFAVEKGVVRQFVAMPLSEGYTAEEQLTGEAKWGGIQISVTPLKRSVWRDLVHMEFGIIREDLLMRNDEEISPMGFAAGGRMKQEIFTDTFNLEDWDQEATQRVFVSILNINNWKKIVQDADLTAPPSAEDYNAAGLPWFEYYGHDWQALSGSQKLSDLESLAQIHNKKTGSVLPGSTDLTVQKKFTLNKYPISPLRKIKNSDSWV